MFAIAPVIQHKLPIEQRAIVEPQMTPTAHTLDEVRAVDAAFIGNNDPTDQVIGLMGLSLSVPWLIDTIAEQLRPSPTAEEEEKPRPQLDKGEEE
jgi:hypothetical protein